MPTYLLTWNPRRNREDTIDWVQRVIAVIRLKGKVRDQWSTGVTTGIKPGARMFLLRQGSDQPGLVASGKVVHGSFTEAHWDPRKAAKGKKTKYVEVEWDAMVMPGQGIARERLKGRLLGLGFVNTQASGRLLPDLVAKRLDKAWRKHLRTNKPHSPRARPTVLLGENADDTFDDLPAGFGSDAPKKLKWQASGVQRDPKVRAAVIKRSKGKCEQPDCGDGRPFSGFLDVHHILGAAKSDRVWNCVALCPNCHRDSHYSPRRRAINRILGIFAAKFKGQATGSGSVVCDNGRRIA